MVRVLRNLLARKYVDIGAGSGGGGGGGGGAVVSPKKIFGGEFLPPQLNFLDRFARSHTIDYLDMGILSVACEAFIYSAMSWVICIECTDVTK